MSQQAAELNTGSHSTIVGVMKCVCCVSCTRSRLRIVPRLMKQSFKDKCVPKLELGNDERESERGIERRHGLRPDLSLCYSLGGGGAVLFVSK
jgi:hypothetical protein